MATPRKLKADECPNVAVNASWPEALPPRNRPILCDVSDFNYQQQVYHHDFYRSFRRLRWLFRYDCRYRLFLMEEVFRKHGVPFEHRRVYELGFGSGDLRMHTPSVPTSLNTCQLRFRMQLPRRSPGWLISG